MVAIPKQHETKKSLTKWKKSLDDMWLLFLLRKINGKQLHLFLICINQNKGLLFQFPFEEFSYSSFALCVGENKPTNLLASVQEIMWSQVILTVGICHAKSCSRAKWNRPCVPYGWKRYFTLSHKYTKKHFTMWLNKACHVFSALHFNIHMLFIAFEDGCSGRSCHSRRDRSIQCQMYCLNMFRVTIRVLFLKRKCI